MLHLFIAPGFEEIEAVVTLDILKRAGLEVATVAMTGKRLVMGAHGIPMMADTLFRRALVSESQCFILPGGMPGAKNLLIHDGLKKALVAHNEKGKLIAAICAAPMILGNFGLLIDRKATCYPGFESEMRGAIPTGDMVTVDNNIITGKGPGAAIEFAFAIASHFVSKDAVERIRYDMMLKNDLH